MLEVREGFTDELFEMVYAAFKVIPECVDRLRPIPEAKDKLRNMKWVVGVYNGQECVAALWGDAEAQAICKPSWQGKWMTRSVLNQFFKIHFAKYNELLAVPRTWLAITVLKRLGFKDYSNDMVLTKADWENRCR